MNPKDLAAEAARWIFSKLPPIKGGYSFTIIELENRIQAAIEKAREQTLAEVERLEKDIRKAMPEGEWDLQTWKNNFDLAMKKIHELESRAAQASELKDESGRSVSEIQKFERLSAEHDDPTMIRAAHASEQGADACDDCCGLGNEDGHCEPIRAAQAGEKRELITCPRCKLLFRRSAQAAKCDGNHAAPTCDDLECWLRESEPLTPDERLSINEFAMSHGEYRAAQAGEEETSNEGNPQEYGDS